MQVLKNYYELMNKFVIEFRTYHLGCLPGIVQVKMHNKLYEHT